MSRLLGDAVGAIGDTKHSMLTVAQFQAQYGPGWILADGSTVTGSKYAAVTTSTTVPDLRGLNLRGRNYGRSTSTGNADGDMAEGTYQSDQFNSHTHTQDSHNHSQNPHSHALNGDVNGPPASSGNYRLNTGIGTIGEGVLVQNHTATNIATTATNQNSGGNETRSRNATVNIFIRIN